MVILIVLLALLQHRLWIGDGSLVAVWGLQRQIAAQKTENDHLRERNQVLEAEVQDLKRGYKAIEERARSELGMVGKGETFYQIIEKPAPQDGTAQQH